MIQRPYVLLSCAMSVDGYIDDSDTDRLLLSNDADFDRVDAVRADCDAILVGANTIRRDNPSLLVRSERRQAERRARGLPEQPLVVTLTASGDLDPRARCFTNGERAKVVYAESAAVERCRAVLSDLATVVDAGAPFDLSGCLADLSERGVRRLLVEGGGGVHTLFLTAGLADELQLVVAPFFVGDPEAPRFTRPGDFPYGPDRPMRLRETRQLGDVVLLRYSIES